MKVAFLLYWKLNHYYRKIKCVLFFFFFLKKTLILYQTCISLSLFLSSSSIVVREATISSTLVPTFVSSMNNNTSCKVNLVLFSSTATNDCQVATNPPNFIPRPLSRPMEQEREEPRDEVANPPSTLLSTSFKVPSFMREFLFCMIPAGKEHCYRNINQWSTLRQKGSFFSYLPIRCILCKCCSPHYLLYLPVWGENV